MRPIQLAPWSRYRLASIFVVLIASRIVQVWLAELPLNLEGAYGDLAKYQEWASQMVDKQVAPYSGVAIEYPPGVIPFLLLPEMARGGRGAYSHWFILTMVIVDLAGFIGVLLISRRWGSYLGVWLWVLGPLTLGPIVYLRLDLIPAVATIWVFERASVGGWWGAGGWLTFGALAKIYPGFLMAPALVVSNEVRRLVAGAAVFAVLLLIPFFRSLPELYDQVIGYHSARGIQVESSWGSAMLVASKLGYQKIFLSFEFGAYEVVSGISRRLKILGTAMSLSALVLGTFFIARTVRKGDVPRLALGMLSLLALLLTFGTVYSPQFTIWLIALAAVALCFPFGTGLRATLLGVLVVAALTQAVYPFTIPDLLASLDPDASEPSSVAGLIVLVARNLSVLGLASLVMWQIARTRRPWP